jgi:hypothetical protein
MLSANSEEVFDFYMHYEEMHAGRGSHCGSEQFQSAFKLAFDRMTCSTGMETDDDDKEACSGRKSALEASTVEALETPQHPPQHATKFVATTARGFTPVTGSSSSSDEDKLPTSPAIKEEDIETDDEVVEAARFTTSAATSMPQLDFPGNTIEVGMAGRVAGRVAGEISKDVAHYPQAESPNVTWNDLWIQMINAGWKSCAGDNFGSLYYIHPSAAPMRKTNMLRSCTEGIHYFSSEDAIHRYVTLHLGWAGEGANKSSPATLVLRARENKKRKQDHALPLDTSSSKKTCEAMPLSAGGGGGGDGGIGSKRSRSPDNDGADRLRLSTSRSMRSSPSAVDEKPSKRRRAEKIANPRAGVLKVPPSAFPREIYLGKDVDPSTPDDLMKIFTPDGSFSVDDPVCPSGSIGDVAAQAYQDMIPFNPEILFPNFIACATCGLEDGYERIACMKCPRSYHAKCFEGSCLPVIANDPSSGDQDTHKKRECVRCESDQLVRPEEDISTGREAMSKTPEKKKIDKAYSKYKNDAKSYRFMSMILWELLQILEKLKSYDYGEIFAVPGVFLIDSFLVILHHFLLSF